MLQIRAFTTLLLLLACTVSFATAVKRPLPENNLLVGLSSQCGNGLVEQAVRDGVNVVVWSFVSLATEDPSINGALRGKTNLQRRTTHQQQVVNFSSTSLDMDCIRGLIRDLDEESFTDVVHLVSVGGWNGGHLDTSFTAQEIYKSWKEFGGDVFHGINWDFQGNDQSDSPDNFFSKECLDKMGQISQIAEEGMYL